MIFRYVLINDRNDTFLHGLLEAVCLADASERVWSIARERDCSPIEISECATTWLELLKPHFDQLKART